MPLHDGRMHMITPMAPCKITWEGGEINPMPFATVVIPAGLENVYIEGDLKALMSSPCDNEALAAELGYRAENVAGLMD